MDISEAVEAMEGMSTAVPYPAGLLELNTRIVLRYSLRETGTSPRYERDSRELSTAPGFRAVDRLI